MDSKRELDRPGLKKARTSRPKSKDKAGNKDRQQQLAYLCNAADHGFDQLKVISQRCERLMQAFSLAKLATDEILKIAYEPDLTQAERDALDAMIFTINACFKGVQV